CAPEAIEDALGVSRIHTEPEVAHAHSHGILVAVDRDDDRVPLPVLDGVADEVAQHATYSARVHLDRRISSRRDEPQFGATSLSEGPHLLDDVFCELSEACRLQFELHRAGVVPADL